MSERARAFHPQRLARTSSDKCCLQNSSQIEDVLLVFVSLSVLPCSLSWLSVLASQITPELEFTLPKYYIEVISQVFAWVHHIIAMVSGRDPQILTSKDCLSYCFCQITDCKDILPGKCPEKHLCGIIRCQNKARSGCIKASRTITSLPFLGLSKMFEQFLTPEYFKNSLFFLHVTPRNE